MSGIVWLASFPKSGNTWFRTFLANLQRNPDKPVFINNIGGGPIASARGPFDAAVGYDSGELSFDEIDLLRPEVYLYQAKEAKETIYCKVHDAFQILPNGRPMFPPEATQAALYFVRNPLDVCVSYAQHGGHENYDDTAEYMGQPMASISRQRFTEPDQLRQRTLSWSGHVLSWADTTLIPVHVVRYEDMKTKPEATFGAAARFAGLSDDPERVRKAIEFSRFEELKRQEEKHGFREKASPQAKAFFRKGEIGSWRQSLTPDQAKKIVSDHSAVMRRFGYLDESAQPVY